ncbi:MAG: hypothetical protein BWY11_00608 [Firmicutes bacterium ADurb.Bin182]|nr:MAG: hypothetical protein BWY11_00608 [Firmicutes bacterium ADurb.Bin182]
MSKKITSNKKKKTVKTKKALLAVSGVAVIAIIGLLLIGGKDKKNNADNDAVREADSSGNGITITISDITEEASFIPYQAGNTKMEVIAVKATDGTVRTALNTCQVCNNSGYGYYIQEGDELVCQNCGNRFNIDQVEKQRNGCNPVPIDEKTDDGTTITISDEFLSKATPLFKRWKI